MEIQGPDGYRNTPGKPVGFLIHCENTIDNWIIDNGFMYQHVFVVVVLVLCFSNMLFMACCQWDAAILCEYYNNVSEVLSVCVLLMVGLLLFVENFGSMSEVECNW